MAGAGYIEDRWLKKRPNPKTGKRERTKLWGSKTKRYRVCGIPGVRRRSFEVQEDAKIWLQNAGADARRGEFVDPRDGQITLTDYIDKHWWPNKIADPATLWTIRGRLEHIKALLGPQPLALIKVPQLRAFIKGMESRAAASTTHEVWGYLSAVLQAAVEDERISKNYCKSKTIQLPQLPERKVRAWPKERVRAVRDALPERYRAMLDVGVAAGLRQGEVFGLAVEDIDEAGGVIRVRRQVKKIGSRLVFALPKRQKVRDVPVPPYLIERLKEHMEIFPPRKVTLPWGDPAEPTTETEAKARAPRTFELVFVGVRGGALRNEVFDPTAWKPALVEAGVIPRPASVRVGKHGHLRPKYATAREDGFHALRHTFASVQLHARENPVAVSKWLGHADASITLRVYGHMMPEADGRGRRAMQEWLIGDRSILPQNPLAP